MLMLFFYCVQMKQAAIGALAVGVAAATTLLLQRTTMFTTTAPTILTSSLETNGKQLDRQRQLASSLSVDLLGHVVVYLDLRSYQAVVGTCSHWSLVRALMQRRGPTYPWVRLTVARTLRAATDRKGTPCLRAMLRAMASMGRFGLRVDSIALGVVNGQDTNTIERMLTPPDEQKNNDMRAFFSCCDQLCIKLQFDSSHALRILEWTNASQLRHLRLGCNVRADSRLADALRELTALRELDVSTRFCIDSSSYSSSSFVPPSVTVMRLRKEICDTGYSTQPTLSKNLRALNIWEDWRGNTIPTVGELRFRVSLLQVVPLLQQLPALQCLAINAAAARALTLYQPPHKCENVTALYYAMYDSTDVNQTIPWSSFPRLREIEMHLFHWEPRVALFPISHHHYHRHRHNRRQI